MEQNQSDLANTVVETKDGATTPERDALYVELDDKTFIDTAKKLIKDSENFYEANYQLKERRLKNKKYLFGRQLDGVKLKDYNARFIDNIIYESQQYIKAMATSRMPDVIIKPGSEREESVKIAEDIGKIVTTALQARERKRVLSLAFLHRPVYLIGVIKPFWNPQKGKYGDWDFKVVHPDNIVVDHRAASNDSMDMDFVAENIEYSVKEWVMRFPDKEKEFYDECRASGVFVGEKNENSEAGMNTKVKGWEIWFTHYEKAGDDSFERVECVGWYYNNLVLRKMKSPNWDWSGEKQTFKYDDETKEKQKLNLDDLMGFLDQSMQNPDMLNQLQTEQVFHNHLSYPEKPYIFIGYDQWGENPIDETSTLEQVILLQDNYDKRGKQVTEMLDRSRGKHIFSADSGLKKEDVEDLDMADPDTDLFVKGKVGDVHAFVQGEMPGPAQTQDMTMLRERIFDKMGVKGPVRGAVDMDSPATNNQLSREGDFTKADDYVDDTITYAAEKMANWMLQFMKLRYTEDHFVQTLGEDGKFVFQKVNRDMIEDGMEVSISASGVDKLKAEQKAMDMAKLQLIDPYSFFTDIGASDPKGRTKKLLMFLDPNMRSMYLQAIGIDVASSMGNALNGADPNAAGGGGAQQAQADIQMILQGQIPPVPQQVDAEYAQVFSDFMMSPEAEQAARQNPQLLQFAEQISQLAQQGAQAPTPQPQPPVGNAVTPDGTGGNISVGPMTSQPQPGNTAKIPMLPPQ